MSHQWIGHASLIIDHHWQLVPRPVEEPCAPLAFFGDDCQGTCRIGDFDPPHSAKHPPAATAGPLQHPSTAITISVQLARFSI